MRFGTLDTFVDFGDWGFRMGRPVANESFVRALLTYGSYDAYHFYCPDVSSRELFKRRIEDLVESPELRRRIVSGTHLEVPAALRDLRFDVFHLGDFTYFVPPLARIRGQKATALPFPITGITHSLDGRQMHMRFLQLMLAGLTPYDGIVCTSRCAAELVRRKFDEISSLLASDLDVDLRCPATTRVIPVGIEDDLYRERDRRGARDFFRIPPDAVVALSVGRFSVRAKVDWSPILELLARMKSAGDLPRFILIVAGGAAPDQEQLLRDVVRSTGLSDTVALCPNFQPEVKSVLYRAADFYLSVVDNFQETFGINVAEAMASGLPIIASDFDGYRDAVIQDDNGFLIPTVSSVEVPAFVADLHPVLDPSVLRLCLSQMVAVDLEQLRTALLRLYREDALRKAMGERSRVLAERFRWPAIVREYEAFWSELRQVMGRTRASSPAGGRNAMAERGSRLLAGNPIASYSHYPTIILDAEDRVRITEVGRSVLDGKADPIRYDDMTSIWSDDIASTILTLARESERRVAEIRSACGSHPNSTPGDVDFHLLWLAKHGAVSITRLPARAEATG